MVGVTTTPTNYVTFFTDYASNNAWKKFTYYAGSSARILAASLAKPQPHLREHTKRVPIH